jgi:hypothetical protein
MFVRVTRVDPKDGTEADVDYKNADSFNLNGAYLLLTKQGKGVPDKQVAVIASGRWSAIELIDEPEP